MTLHKVEAIGILVCVGVMSLALFFLRSDVSKNILSTVPNESQLASISTVNKEDTPEILLENRLRDAFNSNGEITKMVVDDVVLGVGSEVKKGDTVSVHYVGTLQNGTQFDNSHTRGEPFTFVVGEGKVIKGWDEGIIGMKVSGQRLLVIPPDMAYGANAIGPIPANATLLFSIELLAIK